MYVCVCVCTFSSHLMSASVLNLTPCRKINEGLKSPSIVTAAKIMWTICLVFINIDICSQIETQTFWNPHFGSFVANAKQYSMPFSNFWRSEFCHCAAFLTDNTHLTLVCCIVHKTGNELSACAKLIIQTRFL